MTRKKRHKNLTEEKSITNSYIDFRNMYIFVLETVFNEVTLPKDVFVNSINCMTILMKFALN